MARDFALGVAALPTKEMLQSTAAINKFFFMGLNWKRVKVKILISNILLKIGFVFSTTLAFISIAANYIACGEVALCLTGIVVKWWKRKGADYLLDIDTASPLQHMRFHFSASA